MVHSQLNSLDSAFHLTTVVPDTVFGRAFGLGFDFARSKSVSLVVDDGAANTATFNSLASPSMLRHCGSHWDIDFPVLTNGRHSFRIDVLDTAGHVATMTGSVVVDVPERSYRVTFLGAGADSSDALAINERGTIVGWTAIGGSRPQAALWHGGQLQVLTNSDVFLTARAKAVNSQDVVALELRRKSTPTCAEAALWRSDALTFIANGRCDVTDVASINDSSAVVGQELYVHPDGTAGVVPNARDINDRGQVVGRYDNFYFPYAYMWSQNIALPIPAPHGLYCGYQGNQGHFDMRYERINDRGQAIGVGALVTGYVLASDSSLVATPTGAPTNAVDLSLAFGGAIPSALNNTGVVVAAKDATIYLWSKGRTTTVKLDDATWHVDAVSSINDQSQIAARATNASTGQRGAVLLSPMN